jgi:AcrR family transcriptional regulator
MDETISLKNKLLLAAEQILGGTDPEQISLREVARLCGVSHNTPYRHFKDKQDLLAAIAKRGFDDLYAEMERCIKDSDDVLQGSIKGYLGFSQQHPARLKIMIGPSIPDFSLYPELYESAMKTLGLLLKNAQMPDVELPLSAQLRIATTIWACVHGLAHLRLQKTLGFLADPEQPTNEDIELILRAGITRLAKNLESRQTHV